MNNMLTYVWVIVLLVLMYFISEEIVDFKLLLSFSLSGLMTSLLNPYVGVAFYPIPAVTVLRSSLHMMETTGIPEKQMSFHKMKSIIVLFMQTFVALAVFLFSTTRFMLM